MNAFQIDRLVPSTARRRRALVTMSGLFLIGAIAAACGSSTKSTSATPPGPANSVASASVDAATNAKLGTILVDSKGFTLYRLNKDSMGKSVCTADCQKVWPPLLMAGSGSPLGGSGVTGLGTIPVSGGEQITYNGMPLYTFTGDTKPGQTSGQNVTDTWGTWFVVVTSAPAAAAAPAVSQAPASTTPSTTPSTSRTTVSSGGGGPAF